MTEQLPLLEAQSLTYWQKWQIKVEELTKDIKMLKADVTYDIDQDHHNDRMRIIKQKQFELHELIAESIPF